MAPGDNRTGIDDQFNLRKRHPVSRLNLLKNAAQSNWARLVLECSLDVAYGESSGQRLDIFPAKDRPSPVFIFIHGGYFRALDKSFYRYMARPMAKAGMTTVLVNYDLAPKVTVAEIIRQNLSAFAWIRQNIHRWNGDRECMILCGHSVGAFLAARILEEDWSGGGGIRKAVLLSGLYDLGPMKQSYLNRELRLEDADVAALNPSADRTRMKPDLLIAVGAEETVQFIGQSERYSAELSRAGIENALRVLPGINHYTMSRLLSGGANVVMDWILKPEAGNISPFR